MEKIISEPTSQTRQRILTTAMGLFHARSYDAVGVQQICDTAGVTKGSFYHFFDSKEDLALAVIEAFWAYSEQDLRQAFDPALPPMQRIERYVCGIHDKACQMKQQHGHIVGCPFGNFCSEMSTQNEAIRRRLIQVYDDIQGYIEAALREAVQRGEIKADTDIRTAAQSLVAFMQGMSVLGKAYNDTDMIPALARRALALTGAVSSAGS